MVNNVILQGIINGFNGNSVFKNCLLIYERLLDRLPTRELKNKIWDRYFLWQFCTNLNCAQGEKCKYNVPGTKHDIDVNVFAHDRKDLEYIWMTNSFNDNLNYTVKDVSGFFKGKVYCAENREVKNINYVEVSDKTTSEIVDRYLSYTVDGKMLITRHVFQYAAEKLDIYSDDQIETINSPNARLAKMKVSMDKEQNFKISYDSFAKPGARSNAEIKEMTQKAIDHASTPNFTSVKLYDVKFECE